jgi:WD40 repeat protein
VSTSQDGTARVWDGRTGELSAALHGHDGPIRTASFSPDGLLLLTGSDDGTARLWTVHTGEVASLNGHEKAVWRASFSPDQRTVATASEDHTARLWSVTGTPLRTYPMDAEVSDARFVDAEHLVTSSWNGSVSLWELATGRAIRSFRLQRRVRSIATCGGRFLATASGDGYTRLWNSQTGELLRVLEPPHSREAVRTVFDKDCSHLLTASWDRTATIYELVQRAQLEPQRNDRSRTTRLQGHTRELRSAEFDRTGTRIVTASYDRQLGIWDAISGSRLMSLGPAEAELSAATFSPDGSTIAAAAQDGSVEFWNSDTGESIWRLQAHSSGIWDVQFSPDGTRLLTASGDHTARIWDTSWITSQRGEALRERACLQELRGVAQVFTARERDDPILRGVNEPNPCSRIVNWRDRLSNGMRFVVNRVRGSIALLDR